MIRILLTLFKTFVVHLLFLAKKLKCIENFSKFVCHSCLKIFFFHWFWFQCRFSKFISSLVYFSWVEVGKNFVFWLGKLRCGLDSMMSAWMNRIINCFWATECCPPAARCTLLKSDQTCSKSFSLYYMRQETSIWVCNI